MIFISLDLSSLRWPRRGWRDGSPLSVMLLPPGHLSGLPPLRRVRLLRRRGGARAADGPSRASGLPFLPGPRPGIPRWKVRGLSTALRVVPRCFLRLPPGRPVFPPRQARRLRRCRRRMGCLRPVRGSVRRRPQPPPAAAMAAASAAEGLAAEGLGAGVLAAFLTSLSAALAVSAVSVKVRRTSATGWESSCFISFMGSRIGPTSCSMPRRKSVTADRSSRTYLPMVRAMSGSRPGPNTTSATTAMVRISAPLRESNTMSWYSRP